MTVCMEAVEESVSVEVSVTSSGIGSSWKGGRGGSFERRLRRKSLGCSVITTREQSDDHRMNTKGVVTLYRKTRGIYR